MFRMIRGAVFLIAAYAVIQSLPDVARYIKMREM